MNALAEELKEPPSQQTSTGFSQPETEPQSAKELAQQICDAVNHAVATGTLPDVY